MVETIDSLGCMLLQQLGTGFFEVPHCMLLARHYFFVFFENFGFFIFLKIFLKILYCLIAFIVQFHIP